MATSWGCLQVALSVENNLFDGIDGSSNNFDEKDQCLTYSAALYVLLKVGAAVCSVAVSDSIVHSRGKVDLIPKNTKKTIFLIHTESISLMFTEEQPSLWSCALNLF